MKRLSPQAAREWSRSLSYLGAATALLSILAFLSFWLFSPVFMGDDGSQADLKEITLWTGLAMAVFGLVWMVRIYRRDPEAGPSSWRFHKWD